MKDIDGEAEDDWSGYSVSFSSDGTIVAIGAIYNDGNGSQPGHTRIYVWEESSWSQLGEDIDGEAADDNSGLSVSLSADGTVVAIGATSNDENGSFQATRVFTRGMGAVGVNLVKTLMAKRRVIFQVGAFRSPRTAP